MIDTDKEVKNILFDLGVEGNEYGDLVEYISNLHAEVKRLRKGIIDFAKKWKHNYSTKELLEMIE